MITRTRKVPTRGGGETRIADIECDNPTCGNTTTSASADYADRWWVVVGADNGNLHFCNRKCLTRWAVLT